MLEQKVLERRKCSVITVYQLYYHPYIPTDFGYDAYIISLVLVGTGRRRQLIFSIVIISIEQQMMYIAHQYVVIRLRAYRIILAGEKHTPSPWKNITAFRCQSHNFFFYHILCQLWDFNFSFRSVDIDRNQKNRCRILHFHQNIISEINIVYIIYDSAYFSRRTYTIVISRYREPYYNTRPFSFASSIAFSRIVVPFCRKTK